MEVYTSYFARLKSIEERGLVPIAVCQYPPAWYKGAVYKKVAPTYDMIQGMKNSDTRVYSAAEYVESILAPLDRQSVLEDLERLSGGKDVALLCFEKPTDFCHRRMIALFLGYEDCELEF